MVESLLSKTNELSNPLVLYFDSKRVIHLSKNPIFHERNKHIDIRMHFIREINSKESTSREKIPISLYQAYMWTKVLPLNK